MPILETMTKKWKKARATNADDNGFPTRGNLLTDPGYTLATAAQATNYALRNAANLAPGGSGKAGPNFLWFMPYAVGADNVTFSVRVYGVSRVMVADTPGTTHRRWTMLAEFACTASTDTGIAGGLVLDTERFADTITLTYPTAAIPSIEIQTNAANVAGWAKVDLSGSEDYELTFTTGGSATSCNALVKDF